MAKKAESEKKTSKAKKMTMGPRVTEKKAKKMEARKATGKKISKAKETVAKKMVMLRSSDGRDFEVELAVVMQFEAIRSSFDETLFGDQILTPTVPLPNVHGETLGMVIEYCTKHPKAGEKERKDSEALGAWDAKFVNIDPSALYDLLMAAHFLGISELLELCCQTVADMIRGKSAAEIRALFHIEDDFSEQGSEHNRRIERFLEGFGELEFVPE